MTEDNGQVTAAPTVGQLASQGQDAGERTAGPPARQNAATAITGNHPPDPVPGPPAGRQGQAPAWQGPLAGAQLQQQDLTPLMLGMAPAKSPGSGDPAGPGPGRARVR